PRPRDCRRHRTRTAYRAGRIVRRTYGFGCLPTVRRGPQCGIPPFPQQNRAPHPVGQMQVKLEGGTKSGGDGQTRGYAFLARLRADSRLGCGRRNKAGAHTFEDWKPDTLMEMSML